MANQFGPAMSRAQVWRESFTASSEYRQMLRYTGYAFLALVASRIIIEISRHVAVLMPLGVVAALFFSAFELALGVSVLIIALIAIAAIVGLAIYALRRVLGLGR